MYDMVIASRQLDSSECYHMYTKLQLRSFRLHQRNSMLYDIFSFRVYFYFDKLLEQTENTENDYCLYDLLNKHHFFV